MFGHWQFGGICDIFLGARFLAHAKSWFDYTQFCNAERIMIFSEVISGKLSSEINKWALKAHKRVVNFAKLSKSARSNSPSNKSKCYIFLCDNVACYLCLFWCIILRKFVFWRHILLHAYNNKINLNKDDKTTHTHTHTWKRECMIHPIKYKIDEFI